MSNDLVVSGGMVVRPDGADLADIVIRDGKIVDLVTPGSARGERVIDARDRIVLPGGVDAHVHFLIGFMGQKSVYDFYSGTIAALRGGTTTVIDFALQRHGHSLLDGLKHRRVQADRHVTTDYALHVIATDINESTLGEIPTLLEAGVSSFKAYMVYEKERLKVDDGPLYDLMRAMGKHGMLLGLHAENASMIDTAVARCLARGEVAPKYHALSRSPISETEAVSRALLLAADARSPVHIFHLSSGPGLDLIAAAQARGQRAYAETCTHYLALTDEAYQRPDAHLYVMSPPLRSAEHQDRLWQGIASGQIAAVTSDDASYSAAAKELGSASFATTANGVPGVEHRLPLLYTLGVQTGRITLAQLAEVWSTGPARLFGLAPSKGRIAVGSDADLVILDPQTRRRMDPSCNYGAIGYTPYEGLELAGWPTMTLRRGNIAVDGGNFLGKAGDGKFLHRTTMKTDGR